MTMLSECRECKKDFPKHLIHETYIGNVSGIKSGYYPMCPLCSLEIRNNLHELPKGSLFKTKMANKLWKEATEYARKNH